MNGLFKTIDDRIEERYEKQTVSGLKYGIIEVTTNCQNRCPGCYMVRRDKLNIGEMSLETAVRILDLVKDYTGKELETMDLLGGEPLLWPLLQEYTEVLLKRGIKPWVFTNMLAMTEDMAKWFFDRKVNITGKLNIGNPNDPNQLRIQAEMIGRDIKTAKKMIEKIYLIRDVGYRDPLFRVQNLIRKKNIEYVSEYYEFCLFNGIGTDLELMGSGEGVDEKYFKIAPKREQLADMVEKIELLRKSYGLEPKAVLMPHVFGACPFYDKGLYFQVDGGIRACSNSTVTLSNINEKDPIKKAYESELICNRLKLNKSTIGEPCNTCDSYDLTDGCRGGCRATVEGMGDSFGGYTLCPVPVLKSKVEYLAKAMK